MFMSNVKVAPLQSVQDLLMQASWLHNKQLRAFETMINIFSNAMSINPDLTKKINALANDYLEILIPGSKEARKKEEEAFISETANTLNDVSKLLSNYQGSRIKKHA